MKYIILGAVLLVGLTAGVIWYWHDQDDALNQQTFSDLSTLTTKQLKASDYLQLAVINTNPMDRVRCQPGYLPFEFHIVTSGGYSITNWACSDGNGENGYQDAILRFLTNTYDIPFLTADSWDDSVPTIIGDGEEARAKLISQTYAD